MDKNVLRNLSYGVYLMSVMDEKRPTGCIVNSAMQITSSPATIAVSVNHDNYSHACLVKEGKFVLNILGEKCSPSIIGTFGFQSGKEINKFDQTSFHWEEGLPVVDEAIGYLILKVIDTMETSTHTVFLAEVIDAKMQNKDIPMTYAYYHQVVKGKSPKNAPTYIEEENKMEEKKEKWVCSLCGYEYDGEIPFEELPEDYVCPVCFQPKEVFEKQ